MKAKIRKYFYEGITLIKLLFWTLRYYYFAGKQDRNKKNLLFLYKNETWITWALLLGFGLLKQKQSIIFVYSESDFKNCFPMFHSFIKTIIRKVAVDLICIEDYKPGANASISNEKLFRQIAYDYRIEQINVVNLDNLNEILPKYEFDNLRMVEILNSIKQLHTIDSIFTYSGIIWTTATILDFGIKNKIKTFTFEGWSWKPGLIIFGVNEPALNFHFRDRFDSDIKTKKNELQAFYKDYQDFIEGRSNNGWFSDFHNIQSKVTIDNIPERFQNWVNQDKNSLLVLIATNMIGDSATLGREKFFPSQEEWLRQTIRFLIETTDHKLIVRIHPAEEWKKEKLKFSLGSVLHDFEPYFYSRIYPIFAKDKFNTLSLANNIDAILVWTSTVGADFAARGKFLMTAARSNYDDFNFALKTDSIGEYYSNLINLSQLVSDNKTDEDKLIQAQGFFYYLLKENAYKVFGNNYNLINTRLDSKLDDFISKLKHYSFKQNVD